MWLKNYEEEKPLQKNLLREEKKLEKQLGKKTGLKIITLKNKAQQSLKELFNNYNSTNPVVNNIPINYYVKNHTCPKCDSINTGARFLISIPLIDNKLETTKGITKANSFCKDCGYEDEYGGFEKTHRQINRDKKINSILDGVS